MILDDFTEMCDATSLNTGAAGSYLVGSQIDLGAAASYPMGAVNGIYLVISVDTAVTSGGSATVQFHLASDDSAAIATDGSATYHYSSAAIPKATLVAGYTIVTPLPPQFTFERYVGILQTTGTAALTAGKINAFLTLDPARWVAHDAPSQA